MRHFGLWDVSFTFDEWPSNIVMVLGTRGNVGGKMGMITLKDGKWWDGDSKSQGMTWMTI